MPTTNCTLNNGTTCFSRQAPASAASALTGYIIELTSTSQNVLLRLAIVASTATPPPVQYCLYSFQGRKLENAPAIATATFPGLLDAEAPRSVGLLRCWAHLGVSHAHRGLGELMAHLWTKERQFYKSSAMEQHDETCLTSL